MVWIHELRCSMQDLVCMIVGVHEYVLLLRRRWSDMKIVAKIVEHASTFHRSPTTKFCFMDSVSSICSKIPNLIRDICESTQSDVTQLGKCGYLTSWTWLPSDSKTNRNKWIQSLLDPRVHLNGDHICLPIVQKMSDFWRCCLNHWIQSWGQDCWSLILIRSFIWLRSNWSNCLGSVPKVMSTEVVTSYSAWSESEIEIAAVSMIVDTTDFENSKLSSCKVLSCAVKCEITVFKVAEFDDLIHYKWHKQLEESVHVASVEWLESYQQK